MDAASAYIASVPSGRRHAIATVRDLVNANLQPGFEEGTGYATAMIRWSVARALSPRTYNNEPVTLAALGNWQHYMSLYLMNLVHDAQQRAWFEREWRSAGKRLDLGRFTLRFRTLDDLALDVLAEHIQHTSVEALIAAHELAGAQRLISLDEARRSSVP